MTILGVYDKSDSRKKQKKAISKFEKFIGSSREVESDLKISVCYVIPGISGQPDREVVVWGEGVDFDDEANKIMAKRIGVIKIDDQSNIEIGSRSYEGEQALTTAIGFIAFKKNELLS